MEYCEFASTVYYKTDARMKCMNTAPQWLLLPRPTQLC